MINFATLSPGAKLGCKYTFTTGVLGTFSNLSAIPGDDQKIKTPLVYDGSYFEPYSAPPDPNMIAITSEIQLLTQRTYPSTDTVLSGGIMAETNDYVDFSLYKQVLGFSTTEIPTLTAIPQDQLFKLKQLINMADFATAVNTIAISLTNLYCKVAITNNGSTYYTTTGTGQPFTVVDITQPTSTLVNTMMDYTVLNSLTAADYAKIQVTNGCGLVILLGISGTNTTIPYSFNSITFNYEGSDNTPSTIQDFNFVFVGYNRNGDMKFIADQSIQSNITYSTLCNGNVVDGHTQISIPNSQCGNVLYMRLPISGISSTYNSEYDELIAGTTIPMGTEDTVEFWDTNIASFTNTQAVNIDTSGNAAGSTDVVARGGAEPANYLNIDANTPSPNVGFRPVLIVDMHTPVPIRPGTTFPTIPYLMDITPGNVISCEYTANTEGQIGVFRNLGCATKGFLPDFNNPTPDGTFYFICVGYTRDGYPKLIADRVIQTNISLSQIYTGNVPDIVSGLEVQFDRQLQQIRLLNTFIGSNVNVRGEYDDLMTNTLNTSMTASEIWNTTNCLSWTNAQSLNKASFVLVKGFADENLNIAGQQQIRQYIYTYSDGQVGFRPVLIVQPKIIVEDLSVTPYAGYGKDPNQAQFIINATVTMPDGTAGSYALLNNADSKVLSVYSVETSRTITLTDIAVGATTTINIVEQTTDTVVDSFTVYCDPLYRSSTIRNFGDIYGGYQLNDAEIDVTLVRPKSSFVASPVVSGSNSYIEIDLNASKITIG